MARRKLKSIDDYVRALKNGYGKGELESYRPWLRVSDVPSKGRSSITQGITVKREHHTLSDIETSMLYHADFNKHVVDIREQFPLFPLDIVQAIAENVGIAYPNVPKTKTPAVLTTDCLLTLRDQKYSFLAIAVKPSSELRIIRVREKLEIERLLWESLGGRWMLVTEKNFSVTVTENLIWISSVLRGEQFQRIALDSDHVETLREAIAPRTYTIESITSLFAEILKIEDEEAKTVMKQLIWDQVLLINLDVPIEESGLIEVKEWILPVYNFISGETYDFSA